MNLFCTFCLSVHMLLLNDPEAVVIIMFTILQQKDNYWLFSNVTSEHQILAVFLGLLVNLNSI